MLTKDQVAKMSVDQQEMLARVELGHAQHRQVLLDEMRGLHNPWLVVWKIIFSWLLVFASVYFVLQTIKTSPINLVVAMLAVTVLNSMAMVYTVGISRRLNALIKILEEDGQFDSVSKRAPNHEDLKP
jgi:hypothetical protein